MAAKGYPEMHILVYKMAAGGRKDNALGNKLYVWARIIYS